MGGETGIESGSRDTQRRRSDVAAADGSGASDNGIVAPPRTMDSNSASIASVESGGGDVSLGIGDELFLDVLRVDLQYWFRAKLFHEGR